MLKRSLKILLGLTFIIAGSLHFLSPGTYARIMPPYLPWPRFLVAFSGLCEMGLARGYSRASRAGRHGD